MDMTHQASFLRHLTERYPLPVAAIAEQLNHELAARHAAIVVAPPGSGKSTLLPLTILGASEGRILMLEPRRLAARQLAQRMAAMLGEQVGQTIGYQVRFERRVSAQTRIEVVTEGILTRRLATDPTLEGVDCLIFDEFHERSIQSDLSFCLAREVRNLLRHELGIVVMSATIDTHELSKALGARVIECSGRMYPVEVIQAKEDAPVEHIAESVVTAILQGHHDHEGDILAFLPGQADIERCTQLLADRLSPTHVCPLYGRLTPSEQTAAIAPSQPGERKVVLATSIAETSLTIEGVRVVIDSGFCRRLVYDASTGLSHLATVRISHDMARQRTGRAGRVAPGICYRLWTLATDLRMEEQRQPEISVADLTPLVLDVAAFGEAHVMNLPWLTPPPIDSIRKASSELRLLGAIDADGRITSLGRRMEALLCHPRIARMMLQAESSEKKALASDIAAILEEKDVMSSEVNSADMQLRIQALRDARRRNRLGVWSRVERVATEYDRMLRIKPNTSYVGGEDVGRLVAVAYPERIAKSVDHNGSYKLAGGGRVRLDDSDPLAAYEWLAVASLHTSNHGVGRVFLAAPVSMTDVKDLASWHDNLTWITHQGGIVAQRELRIGGLIVESHPQTDISRERLTAVVCEAVAREGQSLLNWNEEVRGLQRRVNLVALWHPELKLPDLSITHLLQTVGQWLPFYLETNGSLMTTVPELRKIPLVNILWNQLSYEQQQAVDRLAPNRIQVPSGSLIRLDYRQGSDIPVLSVRLQECFGMTTTPCVDGGRVPVLMELLSPGFKPVQLTTDLAHFWLTTYFDVRKELRRRYPKHFWPDNPTESPATRGVRRKPKDGNS